MVTSPSLADLRDIHLPPPPPLAALFPEWWMGAGLVAVVLSAAGLGCYLFRRRRLWAALGELSRLVAEYRQGGDKLRLAAGLSRLLRRHALCRYPRADVAGLAGVPWLEFLDAHGGGGAFRNGVGAALVWLPYGGRGEVDAAALIALVRRWLKANPC